MKHLCLIAAALNLRLHRVSNEYQLSSARSGMGISRHANLDCVAAELAKRVVRLKERA